MKNIKIIARNIYTDYQIKFQSGFYIESDMNEYDGSELETENIIGYFEFTYPGWEITGRYDWDCGVYKGEPVISVQTPDGTYYAKRIGAKTLVIERAGDKYSNIGRLKEKAEGEFEIKNGKLISFTPHHNIFGIDSMRRTLTFETNIQRI